MEDTICTNGMLKFGERAYLRLSQHFNLAVYQNGTDIISHLPDTVTWAELSIHPFSTFQELSLLAQKHILDLILFATDSSLEEEAVMISRVKERPALATVPTVVYHPLADMDTYAEFEIRFIPE